MRVLLVMLSCWAILGQSISPSASLTDQDRARLKDIFAQGLSQDIGSVHYAVLGYSLLGEPAATLADKERLCGLAAKQADDTGLEVLYAATGVAAALRCPIKLGPKAAEVVKTNLGEGASVASLYFAAKTQAAIGSKLEAASLKAALLAALKKDDSLLNLGLAFHVAAMLEGDLAAFVDRLEDALVQADEVDGRLLQFEGGLSVTSVVLTGAAALAGKAKKPLPLSGEQLLKFANYLMSRRSVQQVKGAVHLLEAVEVMVNNGQAVPLVIALQGGRSAAVSRATPLLTLAVTDVKGGNPGDLKVVLDSVATTSGKVVGSNLPLKKLEGTASLYQIDLMALNPPAGFYELKLTATPTKGTSKFVGNSGVVIAAKVLTTLAVKDVKLQILDADQTTSGRSFELKYPVKLGQKPTVDYKERIQLNFGVANGDGDNMLVHQAFVRLTHKESKSEVIYIAEADSGKLYKFELDLGAQMDEFKSKSGDYDLTLILGDALATNSVEWGVAELAFSFPEAEANDPRKEAGLYEPQPEISHLFREPEQRPSKMVSNAFTVLVLSPLLLLLICWLRLGVNISNFPLSFSGLGFHAGLGAIFTLYLYFWLQLNMFETIKYLVVVGVVTFLCGNSLLASIAKKNK